MMTDLAASGSVGRERFQEPPGVAEGPRFGHPHRSGGSGDPRVAARIIAQSAFTRRDVHSCEHRGRKTTGERTRVHAVLAVRRQLGVRAGVSPDGGPGRNGATRNGNAKFAQRGHRSKEDALRPTERDQEFTTTATRGPSKIPLIVAVKLLAYRSKLPASVLWMPAKTDQSLTEQTADPAPHCYSLGTAHHPQMRKLHARSES